MDVIDALNSRHSVRSYTGDPVDKGTLLKIVAAATRAPSWGDTQPWEIFVAGGDPLDRLRKGFLARFDHDAPAQIDYERPKSWPPALQQRMVENTGNRYAVQGIARDDEAGRKADRRRQFEFFGAPAVVFLCMDRGLTAWSVFDVGMLAQSIMLAAQEFGLDSIPAINLVSYPDLIRAEVSIPDSVMILLGIALGHADTGASVNKARSIRRPIEEVVCFVGL